MYIFRPGPIQLSVQVKLVSSKVSKDRSFKGYFFLEILTNFDRVTKKQVKKNCAKNAVSRPQGFSVKKMGGTFPTHHMLKAKALGTRLPGSRQGVI